VVNFLGADQGSMSGANVTPAKTLEAAALAAVALADPRAPGRGAPPADTFELPALRAGQSYVRGLYSGGTFCYEAALLLGETLSDVFTNTPVGPALPLADVRKSRAHTVIDLGDDVFTRGRPHPMIDQTLRNERMLEEARDPEVGVVLLDVVLGFGVHPDPAGETAPVVREAIARAAEAGRTLAIVGFVCGTEADPQNTTAQQTKLRQAGMILTRSNAQAVRLAAVIAERAAGATRAAKEARHT
jgi:FdrA protein